MADPNRLNDSVLSANEQALWLDARLRPGFAGHLLLCRFSLQPAPPLAQLQGALDRLCTRHPRLAARVDATGGMPRFVAGPLPHIECLGLRSEAQLEAEVLAPMDPASGPLLRWLQVQLQGEATATHVLVLHHLLGDQRSLSGLCMELLQALGGRVPPPLPASTTSDPASDAGTPAPPWQDADWQAALARPALAATGSRAIGLAHSRRIELTATESARLAELAQRREGSRFECVLAAYADALDIVFGAHPRLLWLPALESLSTTRYDVRSSALLVPAGTERASALAAQVRARRALPSRLPGAAPGERHAVLHTRAPRGLPPALAALAAGIEGSRIELPGAPRLCLHRLPWEPAAFASCAQLLNLGSALQLCVQLDRGLFEAGTAEFLLEHWHACLRRELQLAPPRPAATSQLARAREPRPLSEQLAAACRRHADAIALVEGARSWTYAQLHDAAQRRPLPAGGLLRPNADSNAEQAQQVFTALLRGLWLDCRRDSETPIDTGAGGGLLLQTSGSTGMAATLRLPASALAHYAEALAPQLGLRRGDRLLRFASIQFDAALEELLLCWLAGATVVCLDASAGEARRLSVGAFESVLQREAISVLNVGTAWFRAAVREGLQLPTPVRQLVIGGEACDAESWNLMRARHPALDLVNTYGLSEAAISQTLFRGELPEHVDLVPLGEALAHVQVHVLEPGGTRECGLLEPGELCLSGPGLGAGGRAQQWCDWRGMRLLRSGDRVRRDAQGRLHWLGRLDRQHKHRGQRIDLDALEREAERAQGGAVAALCAADTGDGHLPALRLLHEGDPTPALQQMAQRHSLRLQPLASLPRSPGGKLDRGALQGLLAAADAMGVEDACEPAGDALDALMLALHGRRWPGSTRIYECMDSLGWLRLRSRLEREHGLRVPHEAFDLSLDDLRARLNAASAVRAQAGEVSAASAPVSCPAWPGSASLVEGFLARVARDPERTALIADDQQLSYGELGARVEAQRRQLEAAGIGVGARVAFAATRSVFDIEAMLAIASAGAAFVPIAEAAGSRAARERLRQAGACHWLWPDRLERIEEIPAPAVLTDLAYVLFTSGSSGPPKAVALTHAAALNTVQAMIDRTGLQASDRVLGLSPTQFDLSIFDVFASLAVGACMVWPAEAIRAQPGAWPALLVEHRVSLWNSVPSSLELLLAVLDAEGPGTSLRQLLLSGDFCARSLLQRAQARFPQARITVLGGATEAGIWSCALEAERCRSAHAPYGPALPGQWLRVDAPSGEVGEILIGGASLGLGYLREGALEQRFAPHYRTGDFGRVDADGHVEILGRIDAQLKWRGRRLSAAAGEARLLQDPDVRQACLLVAGGQLHALLALAPGSDPVALRRRLPPPTEDAPEPERWHMLQRLPLTSNGKLDRLALRAWLAAELPSAQAHAPAELASTIAGSDSRARALALWRGLLPAPSACVELDWPAQGGHSLLALQLVETARAQGATRANLAEFLAAPRFETLLGWFEAPADGVSLSDNATSNGRRLDAATRQRLEGLRGAILITGASGMLAASLRASLQSDAGAAASSTAMPPRILAVRAGDCAGAAARLAPLAGDELALPIDLALPRLGLHAEDFAALSAAVGAVWHLAAEVNFLAPLSELQASNVDAVETLYTLARRAGAPLHFVSTLGVFPYRLGADVDEDCWPASDALFASGYAESKWRAEQRLQALRAVDASPPPVHIYRLGLIAGPSLRSSDILGMGMQALRLVRAWPALPLALDVLDHADAVTALRLLARRPAAVWHLQNPSILRLDSAPALRAAGLPALAPSVWLQRLRDYQPDTAEARSARALLLELAPALADESGGGRVRAPRSWATLHALGWRPRSSEDVLRGLLAQLGAEASTCREPAPAARAHR